MSIYDDPTYAEFLKGYIPEPSEPKASGSKRGETYWSDMPTKVGMGILGLGKMAVNAAVGNDNRVYDFLESELKRGTGELSPEQRRQDAAIAETIADKDKGALDVVGSMAGNLRGTAGMLAESLPAMFAGGGVGGLLVRGGGALTGAAVGRVGTLAASGVGEGSIMAADVFDKTGSGAAALQALALGTVTGFIPGNVEAALTRKFAGEAVEGVSDVLVPSLAKAGAVAAAKRAGVAVGSEAGQEFIQEGGQALIEQGANGGALDFQSAMKQGVAGAVMGGVMGGGMHTVAGEGSKAAELKDAEKVLADNPANPVAQAEVALLRAQRDYAEAAPEAREGLRTAVDVAKAAVLAARMPDSRAAQDNLDTARAEAVVASAGVEGARVAADSVSAESTRSIMESATTDEALQSFADGQQAHSTLTIGATGVQNTATGIKQGAEEILAGHTYDEKAAAADLERTTHEAKLRQQKEQREALKLQQIALKVNQERAKLGLPTINADMVPEATGVADTQLEQAPQTPRPTTRLDAAENAMIARRGSTTAAMLFRQFNDLQTPTLQRVLRAAQRGGVEADAKEYIAALVESRAEPVLVGNQVREFMSQPEPRYTLQISPDQQVVDVVDENGDTFDTYRGNQAVHDATATMDRLNTREQTATEPASATSPAAPVPGSTVHLARQRAADQARNDYIAMRQRTVNSDVPSVAIQVADSVANASDEVLKSWRDDSDSSNELAAYAAAVLDLRAATGQGQSASPGAPAELAATEQAMLDDGYGQVAVRGMYNLANQDLIDITNDIGAKRSKREHAFEILQNRQNQYIMNRAQFNARENALENALAALAQVSGRTVDQISTMIAGASEQVLNNILNNPAAQHRAEQQALARIAVAYKNNTHLGNVDQFITTARRTAPQPEPSRVTPAPAAQPRQGGQRRVEADFETRARTALNNGVLDKLGTFWNNVMRGRGQRVFNVNTRDLANVADGFSDLTQSQLNTLKDRYNAELNRQARQWALDNGQVVTMLTNPVISISRGGGRINIEVRALGRNGANPYMVPPDQARQVGDATISTRDGHMTTTGLEDAPGSSNLGYRLGAEIARMAGENVPASDSLLTNNRMRRHMQSVYADSLFGPGHVSPMNAHGGMTPQGVPARVWGAANDVQRVGLNMMRAAHSITEGRAEGSHTAANFTENLQYNRDGKIVAVTEPKHARGWPVGTEVTDAMLLARLSEVDPVLNASAMGRSGAGGVGVDTAKLGIMTNTILAAIEANPTRAIPSWMLPKAKQIGRDIGGWMFSEAETTDTAATGVTQEQVEAEVRNMVGDNAAKVLLDSGVISFVESGEDLTGDTFSDKNGKVQGATMPDGKIVLVLGNLNEETLGPVLAHEALHSTIRNLLGEDTYSALMSRLDTMLKAGEGSQWVKDAEARVPPNTDPEQRLEEIAAYAVELEVKGGTRGNPLVRWARDFMSALRTAIIQNKAFPEALRTWAMQNIQPQDLTRLAVAGLKRAAIGEGTGIRTSLAERDYAAEQAALLEEHRAPGTTNERRSAINTEIAKLRTAQRVRDDANFEMESSRNPRYSVREEAAIVEAPVAPELPGTLNVLDIGRRGGGGRALERLRSAIQDKHVTLRRIQQLAKIGSENIRMDTIGALDRLGSKLMAEQKRLVDEPLAKMENLLDKADFTPDEGRAALDRLLIAAHVKEYNEHIAEINPVKFDAQGNYISGFDNDQHPGSGITNAEAAETLRELTSGNDPKTLALLAAQKEYRKMIADMQAFAVDRGLETQETIDSWNKKFPNYTPFNRELDIQENLSIGTVPGSQGFSLRSGIARRAMGSGAEIVSPLASTMLWGLKTTTRGENAIVARTFLEFAKAFVPNYMSANGELRPMWKVNTVPNARVVKKMNVYRVHLPEGGVSPEFYSREQAENFGTMQQRAWQAANPGVSPRLSGINVEHMYDGEPQNRVVVQPEPNYQNKPNVMIVPVDGENQMIEFDQHSKDAMAIVEAFKGKATSGAATQTMNKVLTPFRMFSRWVMATSTGFNPVFAAFNAARDIQAAAINAGADKIPGWTAADSAKIAAGFIPAAKGIWKQLRAEFDQMHNNVEAPAPVAGSSADWMQRMVAAGGATGIAHSVTDVEAAETQLRRLFGQEAVDKMTGQDVPNDWLSRSDRWITKVGDGFHRFGQGETRGKGEWISKNVVAGIGRLNESAELTTRTLVFKRATELYMAAGHDQETAEKMAANISKNISTNFNRRGNATNVINQLFPFFNAAVQGNARLAETLFEKETYEVKKGDHVLVDQRTKLTPYGKKVASLIGTLGAMQALLLMAAGYDDDEVPKHVKDRAFVIPMPGGTYVAIPMPHGFNLILNAGRELADAGVSFATGNYRKMAQHIADGTWGSLAAMSPAGSAGNPVTDWLPALADPFVSIAMNRDAFGRPIAREDMNPLTPTPGFKRAKEGATGTSKALAEGLNWITGGDQDRPGMVSPTPDQIDFLMGFAGGGVAREGMKAAQTAGYVAKGALGIEQEALPLHRVPLIGRVVGNTQSPEVIHQKVFTAAKELNTLQAHYKGLRERGEKEEAAAFKAEHPELALQDDFAKLTRGESKQKKERVKLREGGEVGKINAMAEKSETRAQELLRRLEEYRAQ